MKVTLRPYGNQRPIPVVPALVQSFIDGQFTETCGEFATRITTDSHDTGHGMDYLNRLTVIKGEAIIYDSGMLKWRNGLPGSTDHPEDCFRNVGLRLDGGTLLLGIESGDDTISVYELKEGRRSRMASCNMDAVRRATEAAKITVTDLPSLRTAFRNEIDYRWTEGSVDFQTDLGPGFMVYHNGHTTDVVWDFVQVLVLHGGKPFISDRVYTGLKWEGKFTDSQMNERSVTGNHFEVKFSAFTRYGANRATVSFDLELPA